MSFRRMQPAVYKPGGGGIMEWFEAYADALDTGYFKVWNCYLAMVMTKYLLRAKYIYQASGVTTEAETYAHESFHIVMLNLVLSCRQSNFLQ